MKWYSIKKYLPPACNYVFIRAVNTMFSNEYDRHFVAMTENFNKVECLDDWEISLGCDLRDIDPKNYVVTHFSIIDPIEVEE